MYDSVFFSLSEISGPLNLDSTVLLHFQSNPADDDELLMKAVFQMYPNNKEKDRRDMGIVDMSLDLK